VSFILNLPLKYQRSSIVFSGNLHFKSFNSDLFSLKLPHVPCLHNYMFFLFFNTLNGPETPRLRTHSLNQRKQFVETFPSYSGNFLSISSSISLRQGAGMPEYITSCFSFLFYGIILYVTCHRDKNNIWKCEMRHTKCVDWRRRSSRLIWAPRRADCQCDKSDGLNLAMHQLWCTDRRTGWGAVSGDRHGHHWERDAHGVDRRRGGLEK